MGRMKNILKIILVKQRRVHFYIRLVSRKSQIPMHIKWLASRHLENRFHICIPLNCSIEDGLILPHQYNVTIGHGCSIGRNVTIYHNVTLGGSGGYYPTIGNNVIIFTGAEVIGNCTVGDGAIIGGVLWLLRMWKRTLLLPEYPQK